MRRWLAIGAAAISAFAFASPAAATVYFCAHSATEIQTDLTAAQNDGDDDIINIVSGNYPLAAALTFVSSEGHAILVIGGYDDAQCAGKPNFAGTGTVLDGQQTVRPLYIGNPGGSVSVEAVTFVNGLPGNNASGGGLLIGSSSGAFVIFSKFSGNRTMGLGGGLYVNSSGEVLVSNNLLFLNRGTEIGGAVISQGSGESYIYNNTIAANKTDTLGDPGGLFIMGGAHFNISNNIVWNNSAAGGSDFGIQSANTRLTNDIGIVTPGSTAGTISGDVSVDPQFAPCSGFLCFDFELASTSPLIDAGADNPLGSIGFVIDLAGKPRIMGSHIDIGAYESEEIFADGFENP